MCGTSEAAVVDLYVGRGQSVHGICDISLLLVILEARGICVRFNVVGVPSIYWWQYSRTKKMVNSRCLENDASVIVRWHDGDNPVRWIGAWSGTWRGVQIKDLHTLRQAFTLICLWILRPGMSAMSQDISIVKFLVVFPTVLVFTNEESAIVRIKLPHEDFSLWSETHADIRPHF